MKQWLLPPGGSTPEDLTLQDAVVPELGLGQVRVAVTALSINARDNMILAGPFGRLPDQSVVPLSDLAGRVDALGPGVEGWSVGDRVMTAHVPAWVTGPAPAFGPGPGSLADPGAAVEYRVVEATTLIASPTHLTDLEAATLQVAGVTAWNSLFGAHPVTAGQRVVVLGSGGVALYAAQLARTAGAEVYAAVRSNPDDERWQAIGIAGAVTTDEAGWGERLYELTGGADKIVNAVGPALVNECLAALRGSGEVAVPGLIDLTTAPTVDVLSMIAKQTSLRGVAVGSVQMHRDLAAFMAEHDLHPILSTTVPFEQIPDAYRAQSTGGLFGKVVINLR